MNESIFENNSLDSNTSEQLPVLYLDWDGVINFFGSRNQYRKRSGFSYMRRGSASPLQNLAWNNGYIIGPFDLNWSAELLRKLAALPVEIVALTTWRESFSQLIAATDWELKDYRVLHWKDGPKESEHAGKIDALLKDQLENPRPFIWADDEAHAFYTDEKRLQLAHIPQLLIEPDENIGLTIEDYNSMVNFLESLKV